LLEAFAAHGAWPRLTKNRQCGCENDAGNQVSLSDAMLGSIHATQARRLMAIFNHQCEIDFNAKTMPPIKMGKGQSWDRTRVIPAVF
jgi:hypothetical protein